jgi:hypothetical protein
VSSQPVFEQTREISGGTIEECFHGVSDHLCEALRKDTTLKYTSQGRFAMMEGVVHYEMTVKFTPHERSGTA